MTVDEIVDELSRSNPWPEHLIRLESTYLFMDGTYFRMYRTQLRALRRFRPGAMLAVQNPNGSRWNITTVIGRAVNAAVEEKRMTRLIVFNGHCRTRRTVRSAISPNEKGGKKATEREQTDMYRLRPCDQVRPSPRCLCAIQAVARSLHRGDRRRTHPQDAFDRTDRWKFASSGRSTGRSWESIYKQVGSKVIGRAAIPPPARHPPMHVATLWILVVPVWPQYAVCAHRHLHITR